ncbi:MAG: zinc-dependent metalloprotease [Chloroflexia bacterium]
MPANRKNLERAFLLGAALGAAYVVTRPKSTPRVGAEKLVDWRRVEDAALSMARRAPEGEIEDRPNWNRRYRAMVGQSAEVIRDYTGYATHRTARRRVRLRPTGLGVGQPRQLPPSLRQSRGAAAQPAGGTSPAAVLLGEVNRQGAEHPDGAPGRHPPGACSASTTSACWARRPSPAAASTSSSAQHRQAERELNLPGDDLRMRIALHETTHAFEFESNAWLREHFNHLLESYFEGLNQQVKGLRGPGVVTKAVERPATVGSARVGSSCSCPTSSACSFAAYRV